MEKKIHYCWFGGKKLPNKVKKCIRTWKKYLPDYEIVEWNENTFDINACEFVKQAYECKKWAFVSDYVRIYALYNEGGIYLDTDMKIIKDVSNIVDKDLFLGTEDSGYFGTAVIGVKEKKNKYIKEILDYYNNIRFFDPKAMYSYANPTIITKILSKYDIKNGDNGIKIIDNNIYVYPRDYFYPLSYDYSEKVYTKNTCMVHLFNATWTSRGERRTVFINRKFGPHFGKAINNTINFLGHCKWVVLHSIREIIMKLALQYSIYFHRKKRINKIKNALAMQSSNYVAICYPDWMGVKNATKNSFGKNILEVLEQYNKKESRLIAQAIIDSGKQLVIFNAFAKGWENIIYALKDIDPSVKVKLLLHGSNALLSEPYDWEVLETMLGLYNKGKIDELGFVKKSLYEFYKAKGYRASFLMNDVTIDNKEKYMPSKSDLSQKLKIGIYSSGNRWVKNVYNQLSAISLFKDAEVDCVPITSKISTISRLYEINLSGVDHGISQEELYKRMAANDINVYVTFTECAPLIPLESLELGTICITGDNHHYFEGTELEKYLVVNKEDDIMAIYDKMKYALENRDKILDLYKEWKKEYSKKAKESIENFLKI